MADIQWGAPLTGEQMLALRDAGLPTWQEYQHEGKRWLSRDFSYNAACSTPFYLPADHIAYKVINYGWLDKPNMRLWFGGPEAPRDWGGKEVLCSVNGPSGNSNLNYLDWSHLGRSGDIIAYIAKAESCPACEPAPCYCELMTKDPNAPEPDATETPVDDHQSDLSSVDDRQTITPEKNRDLALRNLEKCGLRPPSQETVTIALMSKEEAEVWAWNYVVTHPEHPIVMDTLSALGLIKPSAEEISAIMLAALEGLDESGILSSAESNASGMPNWEAVSAKVQAARDAIAMAKKGAA